MVAALETCFMKSFFLFLFDFFSKRRKLCLLVFVLLMGVCAIGAFRVRLVDDIHEMIPHDKGIEAMGNVLGKTKAGEQLMFTLSFSDTAVVDPDSLIAFQESFVAQLDSIGKGYIKQTRGQIDDGADLRLLELVRHNLPLFLEDRDYELIDSLLRPGPLSAALEREHRLLLSPAGMVAKRWLSWDPVGMVPLALEKLKSLQLDDNYEVYEGHILAKDNRRLLFFVDLLHPASATGANEGFFKKLDQLTGQWARDLPGLHIAYFGGPAVAVANATQLRQDTIVTLSITIVLLIALIYYVFRRKRVPLLLMLPVVFGGLFGLAVTAWVQGSISVIALGAGAVILGIAVDFSVHFMSHAREHPNMRDNVGSLVFPLTLGAITTIGAFLALRFSHAPLLRDLGLFAAASLCGASFCTLVFLPHFLAGNLDRKGGDGSLSRPNFIDRLAALRPEGNKWLLCGVILATPVLWFFAGKVTFDSDLMHLNYLSPSLKKAQEELAAQNASALSAVFLVAEADGQQAAMERLEVLKEEVADVSRNPKVRASLNPVRLLPSDQEQERRISAWTAFWAARPDAYSRVAAEARKIGFSAHAFEGFGEALQGPYGKMSPEDVAFIKEMMPMGFGESNGKYYAIATFRVDGPEGRADVFRAFEGRDDVVVADRQWVSEKLLGILHADFDRILAYSALLVFLALLIAYGRIELALISFLPMALTWIWIMGFMGILGLQFNIVNVIIATLIFGLGDDYSIFMMDGLMEEYKTGKNRIRSARSAVYLSVLTTVAGLGTLVFAKHPALSSIAATAVLGLLCVVFVSQVLQPFLFGILIRDRTRKGFMPFTLWGLARSLFAFLYFFVGCAFLTLLGFVLRWFRPLSRSGSSHAFHWALSKYTKSMVFIMAGTRKRWQGLEALDFKEPSLYIANHSSFLDILMVVSLHPKLVLLTNKWVWRSPVFGKIVRMAEYYPVADGIDDGLLPLQDLKSRGYSVLVFPEGSRSYSDRVQRFHKGAFYIAERLRLKIVPLLIHGAHYNMQKGDWLLKSGTITLKAFPAVGPDDASTGATYSQKARYWGQWYREKLAEQKKELETPGYFKDQLLKGLLYKGPVLEWYGKIKLGMEDSYEPFHRLLPLEGRFYDIGCGYGFMSYMLHWASEKRRFIALDYDEEKIETAAHHYKMGYWPMGNKRWAPCPGMLREEDAAFDRPIAFQYADAAAYKLEACDGIIISDMLHYLMPDQQVALLDKCLAALEPGGVLILRDGLKDLSRRHKGTWLSELFSTKILGFNKTKNELHFIDSDFIRSWAEGHGLSIRSYDFSKRTSNVIFEMRKPC